MKKQNWIVGLSVLAIVLAVFSLFRAPEAGIEEEDTFAKIMKNDELAVCYIPWPPSIVKDPNTGELSGFLIDIVQEVANEAELKLNYVESTWGGFPADLNTGRCDAAIAGIYPLIGRSTSVSFTRPFFFAGSGAVVRADNTKIKTVEDLNKKGTKVAVIQGEFGQIFAKKYLPKAELVVLEKSSDFTMPLVAVLSGQADAGFSQTDVISAFTKENPGIKDLYRGQPYVTIPVTWSVRSNDQRLLNFLDNSITYLRFTGFLENKARKYNPEGWFQVEDEFEQLY
ncbi:amino acid ABC transporter substrate-binding protein [Candidatus Woesearchaeota archaeon]|nr:amino acid ABC transporter substrate-binding protein [Candidatus Woesearchaeota archaeon]